MNPGEIELTAVPTGAAGNAIGAVSSDGSVLVLAPTFFDGEDGEDITAQNLAFAIANFSPGFSATVLGNVVLVSGPTGPLGNETAWYATGASPGNFLFFPDNHRLTFAEPYIGPYEIT